MIVRSWLFLIFCLSCFAVQAQTPTIEEEEEEVDTIYYQDEPLVVEKSLIVQSEKRVRFYLSGYAGAFANYNYYIPCDGWDEKLATYKSTIDRSLNYAAGLTLSYSPNKFIISGGLDISSIREKFNYTDEDTVSYSSNNQFNYLDVIVTGGYWMGRENGKISAIASAGFVYNQLLSQKGSLLDITTSEVVEASASKKLRPAQYSITASCKIIFRPQSRMKYNIEPYYMGSMATITQDKYPYLQFYNRVGLRFGVMFSL